MPDLPDPDARHARPVHRPPRWWPASWCLATAGAAVVLLTYYWHLALLTDLYRNIIPGIWLTLARDLRDGLFYRPLISEAGYGGTRYFPLHFSIIAAFLRVGATPETAWLLSNLLSSAVLVSGVYAAVRHLAVPRPMALVFAACGFTPYFIQQSLFELRCDVLAAGLNTWGLAMVLPTWTDTGRRPRLGLAAAAFTLAFATKITSVAVPAAAVVALGLSGRFTHAVRLAAMLAFGDLSVVWSTNTLSGGRAMDNWTATMFAGVGTEGTVASLASGVFVERFFYSRFLAVLLGLALVSTGVTIWLTSRGRTNRNPGLLWLSTLTLLVASGVTAITLSSPGAVAANQTVEWIEVVLIALATQARLASSLVRPLGAAVMVLTLWAAAQDVIQARAFVREDPRTTAGAAVREAVTSRISRTAGAVFSESALWPIVSGRRAEMLDAFMFRIVTRARPPLAEHLATRMAHGEFELLILANDLRSPRGRRWFSEVDLGPEVAAAIDAHYQLESQAASDVFFYTRRPGP